VLLAGGDDASRVGRHAVLTHDGADCAAAGRVANRSRRLLSRRRKRYVNFATTIIDMTADLIISYDGTQHDDDAVALGKLLAETGSSVALAYVRHSREFDPRREQVAQHDAEERLERGAALIEGPVGRHVEVGGATAEVLGELARRDGASIVVFGSDYRSPLGRAEPGTSAQRMLEGGTVAIAVAAAGLRAESDLAIRSIAVPFAGPVNDDARATAASLAAKLGATVVDANSGPVDLIVVGSQLGAPKGRVVVAGEVRNELNSARSSVLVLPAETRIEF
jgi:nucleotide-binding universal stress UspA family protein